MRKRKYLIPDPIVYETSGRWLKHQNFHISLVPNIRGGPGT
jgi:hypothetical protein